jgi:hypothetical protein
MAAPPSAEEDRKPNRQQQYYDKKGSPFHNRGANLGKNPYRRAVFGAF